MSRRGKIALGALFVSVVVAVPLWWSWAHFIVRPRRDAHFRGEDLLTGLACFAEKHGGRLPRSEAEFRASDIVENLPGGSVRIRVPGMAVFFQKSYGETIPDLARYEIRWGTDMETLHLDANGVAVDSDGNEVRLMSVYVGDDLWTHLSRTYTATLVKICAEMRKRNREDGESRRVRLDAPPNRQTDTTEALH